MSTGGVVYEALWLRCLNLSGSQVYGVLFFEGCSFLLIPNFDASILDLEF